MPVIKKQVATVKKAVTKAKAPTGNSVLDRIKPVNASTSGVKICVYGRGKTGKTRLACTFPKPCLLIGTEDGTRSVVGVTEVDFIMVKESADLDQLTTMLMGGHYKTAIIDTAGGLQDIILKEVLDLDQIPVQRTWGMGSGKYQDGRQMWGDVGLQWKERMRALIDLADRIGLNVVVIAHERNFNEDNKPSEIMFPTVGAALTPSAAGWLNGACDYICQTFIQEHETRKNIGTKDKPIWQLTRDGVDYCLRLGSHPVYQTGFRLQPGFELPDIIENPTYEKLNNVIMGGYQTKAK